MWISHLEKEPAVSILRGQEFLEEMLARVRQCLCSDTWSELKAELSCGVASRGSIQIVCIQGYRASGYLSVWGSTSGHRLTY